MTENEIIIYPNKMLRQKSQNVDQIDQNISELVETMNFMMRQNNGVGLSAIQIGVPKKVVILNLGNSSKELKVLINPEMIEKSEETILSQEGCLSFPNVFLVVERHKSVLVRAKDLSGKDFEIEGDNNILAIALQHEIDHLDGVVFSDKVSKLRREMAFAKAKKIKNKS